MIVNELMTRNPACCAPDTSLTDVARLMIENDCGCIPVLDNDGRPVGVITDRDIVLRTLAGNRNPMDLTADACMTRNPVTVTADASVERCCEVLEENQIRRAVVVDEDGVCCGMVSQADLARRSQMLAAEVVAAVSQPSQYAHS